jgi:hypothetical protein
MPIRKVHTAKPWEAIGGHKSWNQYGLLIFCSITRQNSRKKWYVFITYQS